MILNVADMFWERGFAFFRYKCYMRYKSELTTISDKCFCQGNSSATLKIVVVCRPFNSLPVGELGELVPTKVGGGAK